MNEQLLQKIRNCPNLPSLPTIAVEVLDLAQSAEADIAEIARIITKDPALSSKILRTVNSSFYGRSQNVSTISQALVILGLQSVKTLVLGFSLVTNLTKNKSKGFNHIVYWKRSIYAATAARAIAAKISLVQQEEAFLAALLQDIGMLVLDQILGEPYGELNAKIKSHAELATLEAESLGFTHAEAGGILAQQWKLPPLLSVPVGSHHSPEKVTDPTLKKLTELVRVSGRCADVFVDEEPAMAIADVRKLLAEYDNLPDADALLAEIGKRTKEVASLFEINIGSTAEYDAILKRANEALVDLTLQTQQQASQLAQLNQALKERAETDGLTGLSNRGTFDQYLNEHFQEALAQKKYLSVLLLDLDKFKSINDRFGHPAGDAVLKAVAKLLKSAARPQDLAARYGGEELMLILPGTPRAVAAAIAESIRRAIAAKQIVTGQHSIPVTASIGVVCYEPGSPIAAAAHLIKAADLAVYNAKHAGRNCVKVFSLKPNTTTPAAA
jgi:diguanylate cyclase (GGDEF)-like protein